jgi:two-component system, cell cycle sensor histidine kinase PleC
MNAADLSDIQRSDRILVEKLRLLYRGNFAVPTNFAIACLVAYLLRDSFPAPVLIGWLTVTAAVVLGRMLLYKRFLQAATNGLCSKCWARKFCIGAAASGLLWGALCIGLNSWGSAEQYVMLTLVISGVSAGALTTIVTYLPAFLLFAGSMTLPLAYALLQHPAPSIAATGWLMLLFLAVIGFAARNLSKSAVRSIELKIDNQILNESLTAARRERDAARGEKWSTLAQLSHELRTPLNAIIGFSEAMHREFFGPLGNARYKEYSTHVHSSGLHLLTLIDEILQMSQGETGKLTLNESEVDPGEVVRACVAVMAPVAQRSQQRLTTDIPDGLPLLRADATALRQMLFALTDNALTYTPPQGKITIALRLAAEGGLLLEVRDSGIGMREEDIPLALQPFGRIANPLKHKTPGIGLGLPICKRLAEMHGADLAIASEAGVGTTCTIAFPAERSLARPAQDAAVAAA